MNPLMNETGLSISDLAFSFNASDAPILSSVNYQTQRGEKTGIVGPSGCGKSTLLKLMAGLLVPSRGEIYVGGSRVERKTLKQSRELSQKIGMSFQKGGLLDSYCVWENIDFALRELTRFSAEQRREKISTALEQVGLITVQDKRLKELSGGMLKRVSLARLFALSPPVMLLDDPTAGLDPVTAGEIIQLIQKQSEQKKTILIFSTSDLSVAYRLADKISFLWQGSLSVPQSSEEFRNSSHPAIRQFVSGEVTGPLTGDSDA